MKIEVLLINYDSDALGLYVPLLAAHGITARPAATMQEAIALLADGEYSGIAINADNFDCLPSLKIMRKMTAAPIGISTTDYNKADNRQLILSGADIYRVRYDDAERRVERFASLVKLFVEFSAGERTQLPVIIYGELQLFLNTRKVFVKGEEIELMRKKFDILYYLIVNRGIILSQEQIYSRVWGDEFSEDAKGPLWTQICQLRNKLQIDPSLPEYIVTERNYGYSFDPQHRRRRLKALHVYVNLKMDQKTERL